MPGKEVQESDAEGKTKAIFEDIKATMAVPTAGTVFRQLAVYPWFLQLAWRNLKPNAATVYFHRSAGQIGKVAGQSMRAGGTERAGTSRPVLSEEFARTTQSILDLESKMLLATAALTAGINGQVPKMLLIPAADKQTALVEPVSDIAPPPAAASDDQFALADDIGGGLGDLGSLLNWSSDLSTAWKAVSGRCSGSTFLDRADDIRQRTSVAAEGMPFRIEISATSCRQSGLSEDQIDDVRRILRGAWLDISESLLRAAALANVSRPSVATAAAEPEPAAATA